ncbi:hypothetical protein BDR07DRAFT_1426993 [Suillus spraguei]|nr:hypothetical protein BDR07DRAFT_1426993 [Suillus spraguei]
MDDVFHLIRNSVYFIPSAEELLPRMSAIVGGRESNGDILCIVHARYEYSPFIKQDPGKATLKDHVYISHDGREINACLLQYLNLYLIHGKFERLVGDQSSVRWARKLEGAIPVLLVDLAFDGGTEPPEPLYIAHVFVEGGFHCGEVQYDGYAAIPFDGSVIIAESYNVLVFCDVGWF